MDIIRIIRLTLLLATFQFATVWGVGPSGMFQWSANLTGPASSETGKQPVAYLWLPEGCEHINAVVLAQQNMTEERVYHSELFQQEMARLGLGLVWVAPWFSQNWDPATGCQQVFEEMMVALAGQSGHQELSRCAIVPFGHSAQATYPWNFAAWNPDRTLCIISFHGDAPRTNLCGYGTANVEWGRQRNIDGIPGLMIEGEYEWWEARVRPALSFQMMYPESCISFLCDTGRGHFDCGDETILYIAKFIEKSLGQRMQADGTLKRLNRHDGWLCCRYNSDLPANDGNGDANDVYIIDKRPTAAPWTDFKGDRHDAFWYFDREMAELTEKRYSETSGKQQQYVGIVYNGRLIPYDANSGILKIRHNGDGITFILHPVLVDETHSKIVDNISTKCKLEYICGPVEQLNDTTFRLRQYDAGWDNPRRSLSFWLCAVASSDPTHKGAVQPLNVTFDKNLIYKIQ